MTYALPYQPYQPMPVPAMSTRRRRAMRFSDRFMYVMGFLLLGYALGGRGFAYWGVKPIFVGEMTLAMGVVAFLRSGQVIKTLRMTLLLPLLMFVILGAFRSVPFWDKYKFDV